MKISSLPTSVLALALVSIFALNGCDKKPPPRIELRKSIASAEPTSFEQVTAQLDPGGNLYVYVSTEQWLEGLSAKISGWRQLSGVVPDLQPEARDNLGRGFDLVTNLIKDCGLEEISGFGMSSIAREKGFYHTRALLHHYKGKDTGFLWSLFGKMPHSLDALDLLPTTTALATFSDLDLPLAWSVLRKEVNRAGFAAAEQLLNQVPNGFEQATGLKWDQVLASLGNEFGFVLTFNDARMISLPLPGADGPLEIPEPAFMMVARVKDDTIFNRVDEALKATGQQVVQVDQADRKLRTVQIPLPLPIQLRPTIASSGGYLFIASTDSVILEALAVKAGQKPGLKSTAEFRRVAVDVPQKGNQFTFLSQRLGLTIAQIQRRALPMATAAAPQAAWLQSLVSSTNAAFSYAVNANTDEGWSSVGNGNQYAAKMFLVAAAVPVALSAVAIPNFVKARGTAQQTACVSNLRRIDGAKKQWALENNKAEDATPTQGDLMPYFKTHSFPACPAGGEYTIRPVSEPPRCSKSGHTLTPAGTFPR